MRSFTKYNCYFKPNFSNQNWFDWNYITVLHIVLVFIGEIEFKLSIWRWTVFSYFRKRTRHWRRRRQIYYTESNHTLIWIILNRTDNLVLFKGAVPPIFYGHRLMRKVNRWKNKYSLPIFCIKFLSKYNPWLIKCIWSERY